MGEEYTYVANSAYAWGKGDHEIEAFQNMIGHVNPDRVSDDTFECSIVMADGDAHVESDLHHTRTVSDDVVSVTHYEVPVEMVREVRERLGDLEIYVEGVLADTKTETERPEADA